MADDDEEVRKRNTVAAHDAATSIEALEGTALEDGHLAVPQAGGVIDGIAIIAVESARRMAMTEEEADIPPKNAPTAAAVIETHAMIDTGHPTDHGAHRDLALLAITIIGPHNFNKRHGRYILRRNSALRRHGLEMGLLYEYWAALCGRWGIGMMKGDDNMIREFWHEGEDRRRFGIFAVDNGERVDWGWRADMVDRKIKVRYW